MIADILPFELPSHTVEYQFNQFWKIVPRKVAKGTARKAFAKAVKEHSYEDIMAGARLWLRDWPKSRLAKEGQFCPHPSTWLNGERWTDYDDETLEAAQPSTVDARHDNGVNVAHLAKWIETSRKLAAVDALAYDKWIKPLTLTFGTTPTLRAPTAFFKAYIQSHYADDISRAWGERVVIK